MSFFSQTPIPLFPGKVQRWIVEYRPVQFETAEAARLGILAWLRRLSGVRWDPAGTPPPNVLRAHVPMMGPLAANGSRIWTPDSTPFNPSSPSFALLEFRWEPKAGDAINLPSSVIASDGVQLVGVSEPVALEASSTPTAESQPHAAPGLGSQIADAVEGGIIRGGGAVGDAGTAVGATVSNVATGAAWLAAGAFAVGVFVLTLKSNDRR